MTRCKWSIIVLAVGVFLPSAVQAKNRGEPASESAVAAAEEAYERKLQEAQRTHLQQQIEARTAYLGAIAKAKSAALESGDLEQRRRLAELHERIESELKADRKAVQRIEHQLAKNAGIAVRGEGFVLKTLRNEATAYSNRDYKWRNVPEKLQGWTYTQIDGGDTPDFRIKVSEEGVVMVLADSMELVGHGWTHRPELAFHWYPGRSAMRVFSKKVEAGQMVQVPHFGWTGTLVLIPPKASAQEVAATRK